MAQFAASNFNGTENDLLPAFDANWVSQTGTSGTIEIASNRARMTNNTTAAYYFNAAPASADYSVTVDVYNAALSGASVAIGPVVRASSSTNTSYHARYNAATATVNLFRFVGGTATSMGSAARSVPTAGTSATLTLSVVGDLLKVFWNGEGTPLLSVNNTAITAAGFPGIRGSGSGSTDTGGLHLDNFSADEAGGGATYSLEVTPASYSLSGNDAALIANQSLIVTPGSYETTGVSADLTYTSAAAGYELSVTPGSYSLTGNDASLTATSILGITPGAYALTGNAADLSAARNLSVTPGAYLVTGEPVELTFTSSGFYVLDVSPGAYALSGADVALAYSAEVPAASMGFQLGGIREVTHKRLMDRILEARAERIKPVAKRARKRARVIEVQAAEIALTGNEAQFFGLMDDWLEQKPQLPPGIDAEEAFMAQVAMEVQRINERRLFELDEEEALMALLLA